MHGIDLVGLLTRIVPERRARPIASSIHRVLVVKLSSIGDVVHAMPAAMALKRARPDLRVTWAAEDWTAPLLANHPAVDRLVVFPDMMRWPRDPRRWRRAFRTAVAELRREPYDVAVDLQGLAKSAVVSVLSRAPHRIARAGQREGSHLVSWAAPLPPAPRHVVYEYLAVTGMLGASSGDVQFGLTPSSASVRAVDQLLASAGVTSRDPIVVLTPTASRRWKDWPLDRWVDAADRLAGWARVVMAGTPAHCDRHRLIAARTRRPPVNLTGRTSLPELVALLARAAVHVAPDTGAAHISAALGTPVVAVFGPTPPERLAPFGQEHGVFHHREACGTVCAVWCARQRRCLTETTAEDVVAAARARIGAPASVERRSSAGLPPSRRFGGPP